MPEGYIFLLLKYKYTDKIMMNYLKTERERERKRVDEYCEYKCICLHCIYNNLLPTRWWHHHPLYIYPRGRPELPPTLTLEWSPLPDAALVPEFLSPGNSDTSGADHLQCRKNHALNQTDGLNACISILQ